MIYFVYAYNVSIGTAIGISDELDEGFYLP